MKKHSDCARFGALQDRRLARDGDLSEEERAFVTSHGRCCSSCGLELAGLEALRRAGELGRGPEMADSAVSRAVDQILAGARGRAPTRVRLRPLAAGLVGGVAAALVILAQLLGGGAGGERDSREIAPPTPRGGSGARVTMTAGRVLLDGVESAAGASLLPGQEVRVPLGGRAVVAFPDTTTAVISGGTRLLLARASSTLTRFELRRGAVILRVAPRPMDRPLEVRTTWGRIRVIGTLLRVVDAAGSQRVEVLHGRVDVRLAMGLDVLVGAGQSLDASGRSNGLNVAQGRRLVRAEALVGRLAAGEGGVLSVRAAVGSRVLVSSTPLGRSPLTMVLSPGLHRVAALSATGVWEERGVDVVAGTRVEVDFDRPSPAGIGGGPRETPGVGATAGGRERRPRSALAAGRAGSWRDGPPGRALPGAKVTHGGGRKRGASGSSGGGGAGQPSPGSVAPNPSPAAETVGQMLSRAARLRAQRAWTKVVAVYRRLIRLHPAAPEAATCLVLMGQVQLRQLGRARAALASFERYLRSDGGGALAPEAAWGRIESLRLLGLRARERAACRALLRRYPGSIYAARVRSRLRTLGTKKSGPR